MQDMQRNLSPKFIEGNFNKQGWLNEYHVLVYTRKVQNTNPWSMHPIRGPGPWTLSIKIWIGSMDRLSWTGSMDPLFSLALKLVVIKDYDSVLCLDIT